MRRNQIVAKLPVPRQMDKFSKTAHNDCAYLPILAGNTPWLT